MYGKYPIHGTYVTGYPRRWCTEDSLQKLFFFAKLPAGRVWRKIISPPKMWLQGWWLIGGIVPAPKLFIKRLVWDSWKAFTYVEKAFVGPLPVQLNDWKLQDTEDVSGGILTWSFRMFPQVFPIKKWKNTCSPHFVQLAKPKRCVSLSRMQRKKNDERKTQNAFLPRENAPFDPRKMKHRNYLRCPFWAAQVKSTRYRLSFGALSQRRLGP